MRLLCFGDIHLGAGTDYGTAAFGPGSRLADQGAVLRRIVNVAVEEQVDAVLFAGDAFHRRRPSPSEILVWRGFLDMLQEATNSADVIAIDGNHDVVSADLPSALETVKPTAAYEVSRRPQVFTLPATERISVATLPWTPPARLVASRNGGDRDAIHTDVAELLIETAADLRGRVDGPCVLLAHWAVSGASTPGGVPAEAFREPVIALSDLEGLGFDAVVLGHIHKPQMLSAGPLARDENGSHRASGSPIFYVGSPNVIDFGEAESAHGVWLLDTEDWSARFIPVEDRPFVTLDYDLVGHEEFDGRLLGNLPGGGAGDVEGAVVRLRYTATPEQARRVDHAQIREALLRGGASRVYAIQPTIVREDRARVAGVDENLDAGAAMEAWLVSQGIDETRAAELRERGARYLEETRA